jgi:hypothetical protein
MIRATCFSQIIFLILSSWRHLVKSRHYKVNHHTTLSQRDYGNLSEEQV